MPSAAELDAAAATLDAAGDVAAAEAARDRAAAAAAADELLRAAGGAPPAAAPPAAGPPSPAPSASSRELGRQAYERGRAAFDARRYPEALAEFRTAYDLAETSAIRATVQVAIDATLAAMRGAAPPRTPAEAQALNLAEARYVAPGYDPARARELAPLLDRELRKLGTGNRNTRSRKQTGVTLAAIESFARAAFGNRYADAAKAATHTRTNPQGYVPYGGGIRGALVYYGIANTAGALVAPLATFPYSPPEGAAVAGRRRRRR